MYKVFIVDDEVVIVNGLEKIFDWNQMGCLTSCFSNSVEAYEAALADHPDILITDIKMPLMDGLELINRLKASGNKTIFIILSGFSEFEYAKKGISLGINAYILKPVEEEELLAAVKLAINKLEEKNNIQKELEKAKELSVPVNLQTVGQAPCEKDDIIESIKKYIDLHFYENLSLCTISEHFYLNPNYVSNLFKKKAGGTYISYLTKKRMEKARELLASNNAKLYEVCHSIGYENVRHFSKIFEKVVGVKPSSYREKESFKLNP